MAFANKVNDQDFQVKQTRADQKTRPARKYFRLKDIDLTRVSGGGKPEAVYGLEQALKVSKYQSPEKHKAKTNVHVLSPLCPPHRNLNNANRRWKHSLSETKQVFETLSTEEDFQDTYLPSI